MDILHLVDRLEELFNESKSFPLTHKVMVDEERMLDLIDQMRLSIPEEIKNSQQIINQKERVIAQAKEEGQRIVDLAKDQAAKLVARDEIVQKAEAMGENIILKAREETKLIKREADSYAIDSLEHLEVELSKILLQVRNGINTLRGESPPSIDSMPESENIQVNHRTEPAE
jgi:hypothetical protein